MGLEDDSNDSLYIGKVYNQTGVGFLSWLSTCLANRSKNSGRDLYIVLNELFYTPELWKNSDDMNSLVYNGSYKRTYFIISSETISVVPPQVRVQASMLCLFGVEVYADKDVSKIWQMINVEDKSFSNFVDIINTCTADRKYLTIVRPRYTSISNMYWYTTNKLVQ
jgi:hypothetical protein